MPCSYWEAAMMIKDVHWGQAKKSGEIQLPVSVNITLKCFRTHLITTSLDFTFASRESPSSFFVFLNTQHMFREYSHPNTGKHLLRILPHMGILDFVKHFKHNSNVTRKYNGGLELDVNSWVKRYRKDLIRKSWVKRYRKEDYDFILSRR